MSTTKTAKRYHPSRITESRKIVGLSVRGFAHAIGKTGPTVSSWENGVTFPTIRDLEIICEKFGFDLSYFLTSS